MQISHTIFVSLLICAVIACSGCTQPALPGTVATTSGSGGVTEPAQLVLTQSDLPTGFALAESRTKNPSDMNRLALDLGWQGGHVVRYILPARDGNGVYEITHTIAIYPSRAIPDVIAYSYQQAQTDSNFMYSDYTVSGLGEYARGFLGKAGTQIPINTANDNPLMVNPDNPDAKAEFKTDFSEVIFSKGDTFEVIKITGSSPDTALMLNLSKKAYAKIP